MNPDPIILEPMREEDLPQVMDIENASFPTPFSKSLFQMELRLDVARLFVARRSRVNVVGYIDYWKVGGEIHLITLAVHPDSRRRGIAKLLMQRMMDDAGQCGTRWATLDVRVSNEAAIRLYEGFGFQKAGLRKKYYQDNDEDALVMSLEMGKRNASSS